ncbi:MAG: membrane protein FxsA [Desulfuromonas sp.]|nr:MAG: membrane protein FxsA [Desulfuromonas sp.]
MFIKIFFILIFVPILEIYTLIQIGGLLGVWATIALVVLTGIAGTLLLRTQGIDVLREIQEEMNGGRLPAEQLLDGAMILAGGLVLLTPGFWTDLCGFFLLVPTTRRIIKGWLRIWLEQHLRSGTITIHKR